MMTVYRRKKNLGGQEIANEADKEPYGRRMK